MNLRYMVDLHFVDRDEGAYAPIGVWVQGAGMDLVIRYVSGYEDYQAEADLVLDRMVDYGMQAIPPDFLEFHQQSLSSYRGERVIVDSKAFISTEACADVVIRMIEAGHLGGKHG